MNIFKKIICFASVLIIALTVKAQEFTLTGKVNGDFKDSITIYYNNISGKQIKKTQSLDKTGEFAFRGELASPTIAMLIMHSKEGKRAKRGNQTMVFLESGTITFNATEGNFSKAIITGSKSQAEMESLEKQKSLINKKLKPLTDAYQKETDKGNAIKIMEKIEKLNEEKEKLDFSFAEQHPGSYLSAYLLDLHAYNLPIGKIEYYYNFLNPEIKQCPYGESLKNKIENLRAGSPGSKAPNFSTKDINGKTLSLSDFKGKYVILDFWATWCGPCRKGFPHLIKLYNKYKGKGIEVVCISDDDEQPDKWKEAVIHDGIDMWHHILRGFDMKKLMRGENNESDLDNKYCIQTIPTKILIDPNGVIIGRYGSGGENHEALDKKLEKVFGF